MLIGLMAAGFGLAVGVILIRKLRGEISEETAPEPLRASNPLFPLETYHAVIERLKEQEKQLQELRRAESERARASENISASLLSNLPSGVLLFNPNGLVQQANPAARNILGFASISGLHARDVFRGARLVNRGEADPAPATAISAVQAALREGTSSRRLETEYVTPAGEERVLGLTVSPVLSGAGKSLGAACLISDLTEINRLSRQVRMRENLASLGEMSAGIAHEFKNSLATISGYAQMLRQESPDGDARENADRILDQTRALTHVVTEFLRFARPLELSYESVPGRTLVDRVVEEIQEQFPGAAIHISGDFAEIPGDEGLLRQVLLNLVRNAVEATRETSRHSPGREAASRDTSRSEINVTGS